MENLSTEQHAQRIAESITNGQHKQALNQFKNALAEHCNAFSLCQDMNPYLDNPEAVIKLLCNIIEGA